MGKWEFPEILEDVWQYEQRDRTLNMNNHNKSSKEISNLNQSFQNFEDSNGYRIYLPSKILRKDSNHGKGKIFFRFLKQPLFAYVQFE